MVRRPSDSVLDSVDPDSETAEPSTLVSTFISSSVKVSLTFAAATDVAALARRLKAYHGRFHLI